MVLSSAFSEKFEEEAKTAISPSRGATGRTASSSCGESSCGKNWHDGPTLVEVELEFPDYAKEVVEDFDDPTGFLQPPARAVVSFELMRRSEPPTGRKTRTADNPDSDAGGPGYVEKVWDGGNPDWLRWAPNPAYPGVALMLKDLVELLQGPPQTLKQLAAALNKRGHKTLQGSAFTEANVNRAVVAAELVMGNESL